MRPHYLAGQDRQQCRKDRQPSLAEGEAENRGGNLIKKLVLKSIDPMYTRLSRSRFIILIHIYSLTIAMRTFTPAANVSHRIAARILAAMSARITWGRSRSAAVDAIHKTRAPRVGRAPGLPSRRLENIRSK